MAKTFADLKYTIKQKQVIDQLSDESWSIMINSGAVGSGKTKVDNDVFLKELLRLSTISKAMGKKAQYILAGVSSKTISNNVLQELMQDYPMLNIKFDMHGAFELFGVRVVQAYTGSIAGMASIRGMNAWGAYVNEASLAVESVFNEIRSRLRGFNGARLICDTNPDQPNHWLKKKFIDKANDTEAGIIYNHFTMYDNTFLPPKYVHDMEHQLSGVFFDRSILGLWVAGEGAVYRDFNAKTQYFDLQCIPNIVEHYVGVDWGYDHLGVILLFGDDDDGNSYLLEEHIAQHKGIDYWLGVAKDIQERYGNINFWCDSARPDNVGAFIMENINAINADKTILQGIEFVAGLTKQNKLFVTDNAEEFKEEINTYVWDEKSGYPIKKNDHVMDALRYALFNQHKETNVIKTFGGLF